MKKLTLALFLILTVVSVYGSSVSIGLESGMDYNMIAAGKGYKDYIYSGKFGFTASIPVLIEFTPSLALETGLSYYMKNYGYSRTATDDSVSIKTLDYACYNHFLELPLAFRYTCNIPGSKLSLFASLGGFCGFWVYGSREGYIYSVSTKPGLIPFSDITNLESYNVFHAGLLTTLGAQWKFSKRLRASVRAGYSVMLSDLNKREKYGSYPVHNSTVTLTAALMWSFE